MPAAGDYIQAIGKRLYDLHAQSALTVGGKTWAQQVRPGNRLERFLLPARARGEQLVRPERAQVVWDLRLLRGRPATPPATAPATTTFGSVAGLGPRNYYKSYQWQILVEIPDLNYATGTQVETLTELILVTAGAKLALSGVPLDYVNGWGPLSSDYAERPSAPGGPNVRLELTITVPVSVAIKSAEITG